MSQQRTVSYEVAGDLGELRQIVYSLHQHRPEEHPSDEWGDGRMTLFLLCQDQPHAEELALLFLKPTRWRNFPFPKAAFKH